MDQTLTAATQKLNLQPRPGRVPLTDMLSGVQPLPKVPLSPGAKASNIVS